MDYLNFLIERGGRHLNPIAITKQNPHVYKAGPRDEILLSRLSLIFVSCTSSKRARNQLKMGDFCIQKFEYLTKVKQEFKSLFLGQKTINSEKNECEICLNPIKTNELKHLTSNAVNLIFQAMLIPQCDKTVESGSLKLCTKCFESFTTFTEICVHLETLRCQFNKLRIQLGTKVIVGRLNKNGDAWREEIKSTETIFPSCIKSKRELKHVGVVTDQVILNMNHTGQQTVPEPKTQALKKTSKLEMTPIVLLKRLKKPLPTPQPDCYYIDEDIKSEMDFNADEDMDIQSEDDCPTPTLRMLLLSLPGPPTVNQQHLIKKKTPSKKKSSRNDKNILRQLRRMLVPERHYPQKEFSLPFLNEGNGKNDDTSKKGKDITRRKEPSKTQPTEEKRRAKPIIPRRSFRSQKLKKARPHACKQCKKTYKREDHLSRHIRLVHEDGEVQEYVCEHCDKKFVYAHNLLKHTRIHHRPKKCLKKQSAMKLRKKN